jgi:hypothetical protein
MLMTGTVLGAPFRHKWSGVVIDPPAGWRMEIYQGFAPIYHLRRKVEKEDEEEALRRAAARSDDAQVDDDEADELVFGHKCRVSFSWSLKDREQSHKRLREPAFLDHEKVQWEPQYDVVSAERVVTGSIIKVTLIGDAKAAPDRRTMEVHLISPQASVSIRCEASQARFKKLQPEVAAIVAGITLPN